MDITALKQEWLKEEQESFKGWDFSHLHGRWEEEDLPWDYRTIIDRYLKPEYQLLDMGTGGGEFLLSLNHPHQNTSVTEAWEPNLVLCRQRLEPLGVCVKQVKDDEPLPFEDNRFDLVINRHESYDVKEVKRVLKPGGMFITQQVGEKNDERLSHLLISGFQPQFPGLSLPNESRKFREAGFNIIEENEYFPRLRFLDVGAVVFFAKIIEWEFPGFSVEACFDRLCSLQKEVEEQGFIDCRAHRFLIVARNG